MSNIRLDKSSFKMGKMEDMPKNTHYWRAKSLSERLKASWYLISVAYNFDLKEPPRLDKTVFSMNKRS